MLFLEYEQFIAVKGPSSTPPPTQVQDLPTSLSEMKSHQWIGNRDTVEAKMRLCSLKWWKWRIMPRWNRKQRGHQRNTGCGEISHYLPHKHPWLEAKVRQAVRRSWKQRMNHPSSKWPAFDHACHSCHEGDPCDQAVVTSHSRPGSVSSKWQLTLSLFALWTGPDLREVNFLYYY